MLLAERCMYITSLHNSLTFKNNTDFPLLGQNRANSVLHLTDSLFRFLVK